MRARGPSSFPVLTPVTALDHRRGTLKQPRREFSLGQLTVRVLALRKSHQQLGFAAEISQKSSRCVCFGGFTMTFPIHRLTQLDLHLQVSNLRLSSKAVHAPGTPSVNWADALDRAPNPLPRRSTKLGIRLLGEWLDAGGKGMNM